MSVVVDSERLLPMRRLTTILLLLAMSGLLMPAGFLLRLCHCSEAVAAGSSHGCCASAEPSDRTGSRTGQHSCCHAATQSPDSAPVASAACGCVWIKAPIDQPRPTPPDQPWHLLPAPLAPVTLAEVLPQTNLGRFYLWQAAACRPPPLLQRCLPLLI